MRYKNLLVYILNIFSKGGPWFRHSRTILSKPSELFVGFVIVSHLGVFLRTDAGYYDCIYRMIEESATVFLFVLLEAPHLAEL